MKIENWWQRVGLWWVIALAILLIDRLTKIWIEAELYFGQEVAVTPFFDLTLRYNTGAAFSFLANAGGWQIWFFTLVTSLVVVVITWRLYKTSLNNRWEAWFLTLILGGAIGNLYDRLSYGHVVDFLQFHWSNMYYFPAFNIADSSITLGVAVMLFESLFVKKEVK